MFDLGKYAKHEGSDTAIMENGELKKIASTDFDITPTQSAALFNNGKRAALEFFKTWSFEQWKHDFRNS